MARSVPFPGDLFEHLRGLVALARQLEASPRGAFETAAFALHVDVSVLRRRLQALSDWLGLPLLEGRGARLRLTAQGEATRERAGRILAEVERLSEEASGQAPRLRIGCTGTVTTELLPPALQRLGQRFPDLSLTIRRAGSRLGRQLLDSGAIDLAVVRGERAPPGYEVRRLVRDALWLALPSGHPLARRRRLTLEAIAKEPLVSYAPGSFTRRRVMRLLEPLGAVVQVEVEGRAAALRYVALGLGLAFLSLVPGHRVEAPGVALREVTRHFPTTYFWALWRRARQLRAPERALLEHLGQRAR